MVLQVLDNTHFIMAVLITASGALSLLFFLAWIRRRNFFLLYFGIGAAMYGTRLFLERAGLAGGMADLLITQTIPIPLVLSLSELVAPGWKRARRWIVAVYWAGALLGVGSRLLRFDPRIATGVNAAIVLLSIPLFLAMVFLPRRAADRDLRILRTGLMIFFVFIVYNNLVGLRLIRGSGKLEFIGLSIFLCCLGYVALARAQRNEERLLLLNKELEIARDIQSQLLPRAASVPGLVTASRYIPASSVAGDFYDFLAKDGALGVLIADVSGHGVPAALSASMVKVAVRSQLERAGDPAAVLRGMNAILCGNLQGQFVSAAYLFINPAQKALHYAGAGHPPALIWRSRQRRVESLEENGLLLGILPNAGYAEKTTPLERGDRCVLYTDGLLEATCPDGEEFGSERLQDFISANASLAANAFCEALVQKVADWRGQAGQQQDDLTIVAIDCA
jgi:sigma-B regulation protein RsbU (phosphoserine phosphatase)